MRKKSSLQKHKGHAAWLYGSLILAFAAILLVAQLGVLDYHFLESMDTIQSLILGRVSILIPLGLGLWGWHLLRGGRPWAFSLTTLSFLLVMVCFSGTAHQFFTPVGKELYPEYFAQGGGIIGGALLLAAHRLLGPTWTILLLVLLWLGSIVTVVPWRVFTKGWQSASEGLERLREQRRERQEEQQEAEAKQQSPAPFQSSYSRKQGGCSVYHQPEFSNFTEGIVKEKPIQRLLSFVSSGAYDEKEVKEQVKKDPVQIPNWQKESSLGLHPFRPEEPVEQSLEDPLADLLEQEPLRDQLSSLDREEVQPTRELEPQPQAAPVEEPPAETIKIVNSADKQNQAALVENLQREDLNPMEEAASYARLQDEFHLSQEKIADKVGKSRSAVANAMRLLQLDSRVQHFLIDNRLTAGHARALLSLDNGNAQFELAEHIIEEGLNVRQTEALVKEMTEGSEKKQKEKSTPSAESLAVIHAIEEDLKGIFSTKVKISQKKNKGKIEIEYYSPEDLDRLLLMMKQLHEER